jgi:hypothetical protein
MSPPSALIRTLYDPVGWADPEWFAHFGVDGRWPRRFANRVMLRRAQLSNVRREDCDSALARWLVLHWADLPAVAYLAGARLARGRLAGGNALTKLRFNALGFLALPIPILDRRPFIDSELASPVGADVDADQLALASGVSCVKVATRALAFGWQQRIRLKFPYSCDWRDATCVEPPGVALGPRVALRLLQSAAYFYHAENH